MPTSFPPLDATAVPVDSPLHRSQRFLAATYDSVQSFVEVTYQTLRDQRAASRGRLTHAEQDVFRAAIVFAGAGVDTVLKEAVRGCLSIQIGATDTARDKFKDWVTQYIQNGQALNPRRLAELLVTESGPALRIAYLDALASSSMQSQTQVTATLAALGLDASTDRNLFRDAATLNPLFKVRNQIAHEMDMTPSAVSGQGNRSRHDRSITTYVEMSHTGLNYCQRVLNRLQAALPS